MIDHTATLPRATKFAKEFTELCNKHSCKIQLDPYNATLSCVFIKDETVNYEALRTEVQHRVYYPLVNTERKYK